MNAPTTAQERDELVRQLQAMTFRETPEEEAKRLKPRYQDCVRFQVLTWFARSITGSEQTDSMTGRDVATLAVKHRRAATWSNDLSTVNPDAKYYSLWDDSPCLLPVTGHVLVKPFGTGKPVCWIPVEDVKAVMP